MPRPLQIVFFRDAVLSHQREQCPGDCWYCDDEGCRVLLGWADLFMRNILPFHLTFLQNFVAPKRLFIIEAISFL